MMQPHILKIVQHGTSQHVTQQQVLGRPIKPATAATENEMLAESLELGEGSQALVDGYRVWPARPARPRSPRPPATTTEATIASFIGWGPVDDPQFIVLIKLDKPTASIWGSGDRCAAVQAIGDPAGGADANSTRHGAPRAADRDSRQLRLAAYTGIKRPGRLYAHARPCD